jgi:hypothetical protein
MEQGCHAIRAINVLSAVSRSWGHDLAEDQGAWRFTLPPDERPRKQPFGAVVSVSMQKRAISQKQLSACNQVR